MEARLTFDISRLDTDPLLQSDMVNGLRLFMEDYPGGIRHPEGHPLKGTCEVCRLVKLGMLQERGRKVVINPQFAPMVMGKSDQAYIDAIKGWIAYTTMVDEVDATSP